MRRAFLLALALCAVAVPSASASGTGGASAEPDAGALSFGAPARQRPVAKTFVVAPGRIREGGRAKLRVRVVERGVQSVSARVVAIETGSKAVGARFSLGSIRTGRTHTIVWPAGQVPKPGTYLVRLHVKDPHGSTLARASAATGKSRLVVRPRPRPEKPQPEPQSQPTPTSTPVAVAVPPAAGGVFPVAGAHTFAGEDGQFGAGRPGRTHEGQDITAAEGTPIVAPVAGTVRHVANQPTGAGWYAVLDADDGRSMFFAHTQQGSIVVREGQRVTAGTPLARVGSTGRSSGPHLHFEIWNGGWRDRGGTPIDPLPQLLAWDR